MIFRTVFKTMMAAAVLCTLAFTSTPASAQERAGIHIGPNSFGIYLDHGARERWRGKPPARWQRYGDWYADPNHYRPYNRARWTRNDCFPVSRWAYDRRGRDVRIVARMCYRRDGSVFEVPGSQRVVGR